MFKFASKRNSFFFNLLIGKTLILKEKAIRVAKQMMTNQNEGITEDEKIESNTLEVSNTCMEAESFLAGFGELIEVDQDANIEDQEEGNKEHVKVDDTAGHDNAMAMTNSGTTFVTYLILTNSHYISIIDYFL